MPRRFSWGWLMTAEIGVQATGLLGGTSTQDIPQE